MCDCGLPLADAQVKVGASMAVPFALGGHQVHFEGTISSMPSSSEVNVAFPGERPWLVARDHLFAVVALGEGADTSHRSTHRWGLAIVVFDKALYCAR